MENFLYKIVDVLKIATPYGAVFMLIASILINFYCVEYVNYIIVGFFVWLSTFVVLGIIGIILLYDELDAFGWFVALFLIIAPILFTIIYFIQ